VARIPATELEALKQQIDLVALIQSKGVELKPHGSDLVGLCPFHNDTNPSLVVTPSKNLWHCMGACQMGGSVVDWVMKCEGVSFRHAVELLRSGDVSILLSPKIGPRMGTVPKLPSPVKPDSDEQTSLNQVIEFYHETLLKSPECLAYLEKRGIRNDEAITKFKLGFANRTLALRLPDKNRAAGEEIRAKLQKLGVLRDTGHEHFNGSLVIPVVGRDGNVTEVYGRKITYGLKPPCTYHSYLPGPHRGIWNPECLDSREVILCEALIDALTFWVNGFKNVTASYGVEGFTEDHLAGFIRHGIKRVIVAYDRDEAGERGAEKLAKKLLSEGIDCKRVHFPKGMDANSYGCRMKPAQAALRVCLEAAFSMGKPGSIVARAIAPAVAPVEEKPAPAVMPEVKAEAPQTPAAPPAAEGTEEKTATKEKNAAAFFPLAAAAPAVPAEIAPGTVAVVIEAAPIIPAALALEPAAPIAEMAAAHVGAVEPETGAAFSRANIPAEVRGDDIMIRFGEREYRVRGLCKNLSYDLMRVNIRASVDVRYHIDTLDLYNAKSRTAYINAAAEETGVKADVIKRDLGRVLMKLEQFQEEQIRKTLEGDKVSEVVLSESEKNAALEFLSSPNLLDKILADFERCGVVGEETNKLVGYLASVSRQLEDPLAVMIQSSSAAGKSSLMEAVLAMMPPEEKVKYSAMTGQSLFYIGEKNLKNKILAIAEEEGAAQASYALKLLQSEGEISIASTGKDPASGKLITHEYRVEGPVMIFLTTTAIEIDEELMNRCLVLTVNEDRRQTKAIHELQRSGQTLEGLLSRKEREHVRKLHQDAQRMIRPLLVANPFAKNLTFLDNQTRTRRDHVKYLTLIRAIALLHQYQREIMRVEHHGKLVEYIEVTARDIETANRLCHQVLGRSLDELAPQTRRLLAQVTGMVSGHCEKAGIDRADYRFTRKQVRDHCGWSDFQVQKHMHKLADLEYVLVHRGGRGQLFVYELVFDGNPGETASHMMGLVNPTTGGAPMTQSFEQSNGNYEPPYSPQIAQKFRGYSTPESGSGGGSPAKIAEIGEKNAHGGCLRRSGRSYRSESRCRGRVVSRIRYPGYHNPMPRLNAEVEEALIAVKGRAPKEVRQAPTDDTLRAFAEMFYEWLKEMNFSHSTILNRKYHFRRFIAWCEDRGVTRPQEVSQELIERFQKYIYRYRSEKTGETYSFTAQRGMLHSVRVFFTWLRKRGYMAVNPALDIEMPRLEKRLPRYLISVEEVEKILAQIDASDPLGIRDRAIIETLYSTGVRRGEMSNLKIYDLDLDRGTLMIRQGKGKRDRMVPIGERAMAWLRKYMEQVRPLMVAEPDHGFIFVLPRFGGPINERRMSAIVTRYVDKAEIGKKGSCHLFRHAMATLMMENGADIRFIQQMLGHQQITTTEVYTNLTIKKLKEIHTAFHPAKMKHADAAAEATPEATEEPAAASTEKKDGGA